MAGALRVTRSVSFDLLRCDVSDDDDDVLLLKNEAFSEKTASRRRRRRKRNMLKQSLSLSPGTSADLDAVLSCTGLDSSVGDENEASPSDSPAFGLHKPPAVPIYANGLHHIADKSASSSEDSGISCFSDSQSCASSRAGCPAVETNSSEDAQFSEEVISTLDDLDDAPDAAHIDEVTGYGDSMSVGLSTGGSTVISEKSAIYPTGLEDTASSRPSGGELSCSPPIIHLSPLLRQRTLSTPEKDFEIQKNLSRSGSRRLEPDGGNAFPALPTPFDLSGGEKLDWKQVMTTNSEYPGAVEVSPFQYIFDELTEITGGTALEITTRAGNEQSRERVYNVLFHVPWRCELLIDVGFFVCLDSFLSLLTVMPIRLLVSLWKCLRQLRTLQAEDWCDFGCLLILILGVRVLQQADISFIYHSIRFEPNIKLYMIYNMLEVFDKLFQSFGVDVLEVLFNSAISFANCSSEGVLAFARLCFDQFIAVICFILHSFIILSEAITISAALHHAATNKSLLVLLMSNNFAEIKSSVFKRYSKDNMHNLAHTDTVERFHILTCLFFVFVQNIMIIEGPWMSSFLRNAAMVMLCEALVDLIKHSFLAKFNYIKPAAYSEFLKSLCEQVLSSRRKDAQKALHFVPIGPACVVIRVLIPLYGAFVTTQSLWKNWLWSSILAVGTFTFLAASKVVVGFTLRMYAAWYLKRCHDREKHHHAD